MHDQPSVSELIEAVKSFIDETAAPNLKGHAAFHARVASNALATVLRDLEQRPGAEAQERAGLTNLLDAEDNQSTDQLNRELSARIRSGKMTVDTPGLIEHLKRTTMAQVEIDQPRYSGLKTAKT
jgi:murein L,D-transpeptidase YcbB/YkuD